MSADDAGHAFRNRIASLYNIDFYLLPELSSEDWGEFRRDPPRYFMNRADAVQAAAIWREVEKRQPAPRPLFDVEFRYQLADLLSDLHKRKPEAIDAAAEVIKLFRANGLKAADGDQSND